MFDRLFKFLMLSTDVPCWLAISDRVSPDFTVTVSALADSSPKETPAKTVPVKMLSVLIVFELIIKIIS